MATASTITTDWRLGKRCKSPVIHSEKGIQSSGTIATIKLRFLISSKHVSSSVVSSRKKFGYSIKSVCKQGNAEQITSRLISPLSGAPPCILKLHRPEPALHII
ncbi:hypothetical protein GOP47_0020094 [Adiantum capillus-veneris]|uniref:Uncharacterized protein n=1 Tax=Adiantum capillus-veneris TaxID=13818 RepID=A0A9D4UDP7_ADICA|nr:hypothetical protein GOP47_0020094 [Adiantum capillus-veneris]